MAMNNNKWQFWIDRGGTFTDVVAKRPDGQLVTHKLLSENTERYVDAPVQGIRELLGIPANQPIPAELIEVVKMGNHRRDKCVARTKRRSHPSPHYQRFPRRLKDWLSKPSRHLRPGNNSTRNALRTSYRSRRTLQRHR